MSWGNDRALYSRLLSCRPRASGDPYAHALILVTAARIPSAASPSRAQRKLGDARRDIQPDLAGDRYGLQRHRTVGAAHKHIGAEADRDGGLAGSARVVAGE